MMMMMMVMVMMMMMMINYHPCPRLKGNGSKGRPVASALDRQRACRLGS